MIFSLWIGHDDARTTTMGCVYRDWEPTHTVICVATAHREWRVVWERGKPWTMYLDRIQDDPDVLLWKSSTVPIVHVGPLPPGIRTDLNTPESPTPCWEPTQKKGTL